MISPFTTAFILQKAKMMNRLVHLGRRRALDSLCAGNQQLDIFSEEFYTEVASGIEEST